MRLRRFLLVIITGLLLSLLVPVQAQNDDPIVLRVSTAYNGFFRPNLWFPLQIQVSNDGVSIHGRISVRPETTGRDIATAYSTPIELPTGSEKNVFLYIQARDIAEQVIVELITDDGVRVAEQAVGLASIHSQDSLYVVVSSKVANNLTLNGASASKYQAHQARWEVENVPPQYQALMALNALILYDLNSEDFTVGQRAAIEQWVTMGGHLIVIGGPNWAQTANSLQDWLPLLPTSSENVNQLDALNHFINNQSELQGRTLVTTGNLTEDAQVLVETDDELPLYIRRTMGLGTVDYFTVDPSLEPLRSWQYQADFWRGIINSLQPQPGWIRGILDSNYAARSVAILPGEDLLPSVLSMMGFILAYVLLIGPINYLLLSRINRRAWGWFTIPIFIAVFTTLAWTVGFNLRGNEVIVSRQFIVQSFVGQETARQDELLGIFSPRRETYTIAAPPDTFLKALPGLADDSILQADVQRSTIDIVQSDRFVAEDVAIDGGIFANFALSNTVEAPAISGTVNLSYDAANTAEDTNFSGRSIRGFVRNDSDISLHNAVILTGNYFYWVDGLIEPGDLLNFDSKDFKLVHADEDDLLSLSSPLQTSFALNLGRYTLSSSNFLSSIMTSQVILGTNGWTTSARFRDDIPFRDDRSSKINRYRSILFSFVRDQYASSNIGNRAFLIGWSDAPHDKDISIENTDYRVVDSSLYITELTVELEPPPANETLTLGSDQFKWSYLEQDANSSGGLEEFYIINPGEVVIRFTPIEGAVLDTVSKLSIQFDRSSSYGHDIQFAIWNWQSNLWDVPITSSVQTEYEFENPVDYLGPNNTVDIRLKLDRLTQNQSSSVRIRGVHLSQTGTFK